MKEYTYNLIEGHIIFEANERTVLLDTGAPSSIGEGSLNFCGEEFQLVNNYMGITTSSLSNLMGLSIDVLVGADIIKNFDLLIEPVGKALKFSEEIKEDGYIVPLDIILGIPIFEVSINEEIIKVFFDTGAQLSYIERNFVNEMKPFGQKEDFYPGIGRFSTETYELETTLGDKTFLLEYGVLPELLQMTLTMAGARGIIGTKILDHFECVLSIKRKELILKKLRNEK